MSVFSVNSDANKQQENNIRISVALSREDKKLADDFVVAYHSYVASPKTVGRCIKYLIYDNDILVGTFWLGSGFRPTPKAILEHFGIRQSDFDKIFNEVADNKRFCLRSPYPNFGSMVLSLIRKRSKGDWMERYGDNLRAIVTTVGADKSGSIYKADNWICIGETSGLPGGRKSVSMKWDNAETIKERFVKPTGENKKRIFITERIG